MEEKLLDMQKHILNYLAGRKDNPCGLNNIFDILDQYTEEDLEIALNRLREEGYADFLWACGSDAQIVITEKGSAHLVGLK